MDKLAIVDAVFDHTMGAAGAFAADPDIQGFAVGYKSAKAVKARKNESYAIVVFVDPDLPEEKLKALPKRIRIGKAEIPALAGLASIAKNVSVHVRVEKRRPIPVNAEAAIPIANAFATTILTGGDPVFSNGILLGTAGYVFKIGGMLQLVSNNHVLEGAGLGGLVTDAAGTSLARVTTLNPVVDSAFAVLEAGVSFAPKIPGIGKPTSISPGIDLGMVYKKRGTSTGITEFSINFKKGVFQGIPFATGINTAGKSVPSVGKGDSGSIAVGQNNDVAGLVFRGAIELGTGPNGPLLQEIWIIDISRAFPGISLP